MAVTYKLRAERIFELDEYSAKLPQPLMEFVNDDISRFAVAIAHKYRKTHTHTCGTGVKPQTR